MSNSNSHLAFHALYYIWKTKSLGGTAKIIGLPHHAHVTSIVRKLESVTLCKLVKARPTGRKSTLTDAGFLFMTTLRQFRDDRDDYPLI